MKNKHQVAIVTGGGKRLGRQIALALGQSGYDVIINYWHSKVEAIKTAEMIRKRGGRAFSFKADISKKRDVNRLVTKAVSTWGRVDLLVNNSAVFMNSTWTETTEKNWDTTLNINLKGTFLCSQRVAVEMLKQKKGKIINIASLGGLQPWPNYLPYSVSKAGVIMLTKILAKALAPHVLVNAVAPGTILLKGEESSMIRHTPKKKILLRKYGTPSDVIEAVLFLAKTNYVTGQILAVDGGRSIQ